MKWLGLWYSFDRLVDDDGNILAEISLYSGEVHGRARYEGAEVKKFSTAHAARSAMEKEILENAAKGLTEPLVV